MVRDVAKGLKWAGREHRWEKRTAYVIIVALIVSCIAYYYWFYPGEIALGSLFLVGIVHGIARLCHRMEQHYLKGTRPWKK